MVDYEKLLALRARKVDEINSNWERVTGGIFREEERPSGLVVFHSVQPGEVLREKRVGMQAEAIVVDSSPVTVELRRSDGERFDPGNFDVPQNIKTRFRKTEIERLRIPNIRYIP